MFTIFPRIEITADSVKVVIKYRKSPTTEIERRLDRAIALLKSIQRLPCFQQIALNIDENLVPFDQFEANLHNSIMHAQVFKYQIENLSASSFEGLPAEVQA